MYRYTKGHFAVNYEAIILDACIYGIPVNNFKIPVNNFKGVNNPVNK